jgi:hypothetical protein
MLTVVVCLSLGLGWLCLTCAAVQLVLLLDNRPWLPSQLLRSVSVFMRSASPASTSLPALLVVLAMDLVARLVDVVRFRWAVARNVAADGPRRRRRLNQRRAHNDQGLGMGWLRTSLPPLERVFDAGASLPSGPGIALRPGTAGESLTFSFTVRAPLFSSLSV